MKISSIPPMLKTIHSVGNALLIKGEAGIGKSDIVRQFAKTNDFHVEILMLGQQEVGDLIGIPHNVMRNGVMITEWSKPCWLQNMEEAAWPLEFTKDDLEFEDKDFGSLVSSRLSHNNITREELTKLYCEHFKISYKPEALIHGQNRVSCKKSKHTGAFLDELNRASPDVKGASLQLILDRQIHQHKLPIVKGKKCLMVAAINPDQSDAGEYQVQGLDPAMLDRMLHVEAEVDVESWLNWARENNVNPCIREFIAENNEFIYNTPKDGRWATPRSWTMLAKHIDEYEKGLIPEELLMPLLSGQIGSGIGTRLFSFIQNYSKGLKIEEITKVANEVFSKNKDIEETAKSINGLFTKYKIDQIVMQEKTEQLISTLLPSKASKDDLEQVVPIYAMLYALPVETLASIIYSCRDNKPEEYKVLATMDTYFNSKGEKRLFMKLLAK